jgi:3-methylfumaryl-CoA hydratase
VNTASFEQWLGRTRHDEDEVTLGAIIRLAATLDLAGDAFRRESAIPESWYAILFGPTARQSALGPDGHPATGEFIPPMDGTRRMFAGRRVTFHRPLRIGDRVSRRSMVTRVERKTGRTGPFTLVTLVQEIGTAAGLAVTEAQDVIYRAGIEPGATARQTEPQPFAETAAWTRSIPLHPVLLFRYSALTFNAHRIHYDLPYTREVEGYPALVMNGGLTALLLVETARQYLGKPIAAYAARAVAPLFAGSTVTFSGRIAGNTALLWAGAPDGGLAYRLDVTLGEEAR